MYSPDPCLLSEAKEAKESALHILRSGKNEKLQEACMDYIYSIGTLAFIGQGEVAPKDLDHIVQEGLAGLNGDDLGTAIGEILRLALELDLAEGIERTILEERLVDALSVRDRYELILEGARIVLGKEVKVSDECQATLMSFDDLIRPELWRLLPLGKRRTAKVIWAAPEYRPRLWWWWEGCDLPHDIIDQMVNVAEMINSFPEAEAELYRHIKAVKLLKR